MAKKKKRTKAEKTEKVKKIEKVEEVKEEVKEEETSITNKIHDMLFIRTGSEWSVSDDNSLTNDVEYINKLIKLLMEAEIYPSDLYEELNPPKKEKQPGKSDMSNDKGYYNRSKWARVKNLLNGQAVNVSLDDIPYENFISYYRAVIGRKESDERKKRKEEEKRLRQIAKDKQKTEETEKIKIGEEFEEILEKEAEISKDETKDIEEYYNITKEIEQAAQKTQENIDRPDEKQPEFIEESDEDLEKKQTEEMQKKQLDGQVNEAVQNIINDGIDSTARETQRANDAPSLIEPIEEKTNIDLLELKRLFKLLNEKLISLGKYLAKNQQIELASNDSEINELLESIFIIYTSIEPIIRRSVDPDYVFGNDFEIDLYNLYDSETSSLVSKINDKIKERRERILTLYSKKRNIISLSQEIKESGIEFNILKDRLEKIKKISLTGRRLQYDGLVRQDIGALPVPDEGADIVRETLEEIDHILEGDATNEGVFTYLSDILNVVSQDTYNVFLSVVNNDIGSLLSPGSFISPLVTRLIARLLYSDELEEQKEPDIELVEKDVKAFFEGRDKKLNKVSESTLEKIRNKLKLIIEKPPPIQKKPIPREKRKDLPPPAKKEEEKEVVIDIFLRNINEYMSSTEQKDEIDLNEISIYNKLWSIFENTRESKEPLDEKEMEEVDSYFSKYTNIIRNSLLASMSINNGLDIMRNVKDSIEDMMPEPDIDIDAILRAAEASGRGINYLRDRAGDVAYALLPVVARVPALRGQSMDSISVFLTGLILSYIGENIYNWLSTNTDNITILEEERKRTHGKTVEFYKGQEKPVPVEDIDKPMGDSWLRPEFNMVGTSYFDNKFDQTPFKIENTEWAKFNYTGIDTQNKIEIDNKFNDYLRYSGDLFMPKYQKEMKPPSTRTINNSYSKMSDMFQLDQSFKNKFDGAVTEYEKLYNQYNRTPFQDNWLKNALYHSDNSTL